MLRGVRIVATAVMLFAILVGGIALSPDRRVSSAASQLSVPGDVDCNGVANSIDAALILQFSAELIDVLGCSQDADVGDFNSISAVDAALVLQYSAGLLDHLETAQGPGSTSLPPSVGVTQLAAGTYFTCALTTRAGVKCWGENLAHSLGIQRTCFSHVFYNVACSTVPVDVPGLSDATVLSSGTGLISGHSCALTSSGGVKCWGTNEWGELGDGTNGDRSTPTDVLGLTQQVVAVATGGYHSCALVSDGANTGGYGAKCWGQNVSGQLGIGSVGAGYASPVAVEGLATGVFAIAAGTYHTCAIVGADAVASDHRIKCWGYNNFGKLGNGSQFGGDSDLPVDVHWDDQWGGAVSIAGGEGFTCGLTTAGGVKCWGNNESGQLGNGSTMESATPVDVTGLASGVVRIAAGGAHACALTGDGALKCWGNNGGGQLGNGTGINSSTPVEVVGMGSGVAGVVAGLVHTCAWTMTGDASCWGRNLEGQLGDGTTTDRLTPVGVVGLVGATRMAP